VNINEKKINLFTSLLSDPNAEKALLREIAEKCNFSFFMPWQYIYQCQCCVENKHFSLKAVQFSEIIPDELSKMF
jgi:hypothetical protein